MKITIEVVVDHASIVSYRDVLKALECTAGSLSDAEAPLVPGEQGYIFTANAEDVGVFVVETENVRELDHSYQSYDQGASLPEGWLVADDSERGLEIQKFDESDRFESDEEAENHVRDAADLGDKNAIAALRLISK